MLYRKLKSEIKDLTRKFKAKNDYIAELCDKKYGVFLSSEKRETGDLPVTQISGDFGVSAFVFFDLKIKKGKIFITNIGLSENPKLAAEFTEIRKKPEIEK